LPRNKGGNLQLDPGREKQKTTILHPDCELPKIPVPSVGNGGAPALQMGIEIATDNDGEVKHTTIRVERKEKRVVIERSRLGNHVKIQ
jgi:hypothetical protein